MRQNGGPAKPLSRDTRQGQGWAWPWVSVYFKFQGCVSVSLFAVSSVFGKTSGLCVHKCLLSDEGNALFLEILKYLRDGLIHPISWMRTQAYVQIAIFCSKSAQCGGGRRGTGKHSGNTGE